MQPDTKKKWNRYFQYTCLSLVSAITGNEQPNTKKNETVISSIHDRHWSVLLLVMSNTIQKKWNRYFQYTWSSLVSAITGNEQPNTKKMKPLFPVYMIVIGQLYYCMVICIMRL